MIAGTSSRRIPRDAGRSLPPAFEQLHLPWLCPRIYRRAQSPFRPQSHRRSTATVVPRRPAPLSRTQSSPSVARPTAQSGHQERSYAYAASTNHGFSQSDNDYIPLVTDGLPFGSPSWGRSPSNTGLSFRDPLIIEDSTFLDAKVGNRGLRDAAELHQNLEACLAVGLHERAAFVMRQLTNNYQKDDPDLIRAHNFYIGHLIGVYNTSEDEQVFHYIQKWYHVDMISEGVQPDHATYAMMVQLMLRDPDSFRAARGIRKYLGAAASTGYRDAMITELQSVLSTDELHRIKGLVNGLDDLSVPEAVRQLSDDLIEDEWDEQESEQHTWESLIPEVRPVPQKGGGMKSLEQSLSVLTSNPITASDMRNQDMDLNKARQRRLEEDAQTAAIDRWRLENEALKKRGGVSMALQSKPVGARMWQWHTTLVKQIEAECIKFLDSTASPEIKAKPLEQTAYAPYLRFVTPEKLSALTLIATTNVFAQTRKNKPIPLSAVASAIGDAVEKESAQAWLKLKRKNRFVLNAAAKGEKGIMTDLQPVDNPTQQNGASMRKFKANPRPLQSNLEVPEWSAMTRARVGGALLSLLVASAKMPPAGVSLHGTLELSTRPAFTHTIGYANGNKLGILKCDEQLLQQLRVEPTSSALTKHLPMLTPPVPWSGYTTGAYLTPGTKVIRMGAPTFQSTSYIKLAIENGDMQQVLKGLDVLGKVPWRVNRKVFDVLLQAWNSGEPIANLAPLDPVVPVPDPLPENASERDEWTYNAAMRAARNKVVGYHSERCFQNFQLTIARAYLNERLYMPHSMDFRGRAYPIPPYLNHMGADHCRGLLTFATGKELGSRGLNWLKIHLANVYGYDKASLSERAAFAEDNLEDILDSANHGLDGKKWWLKAEDPWQCLAACIELRDALQLPDPTKFISHLPVHQDGTCNGLQHYAALGGDEAGARQVNLEPGDRPSDIYSAVADLVKGYVKEDVENGLELAKLLEDKIVRKVVKQTVMTNVYGVTFRGAQVQVATRLKELYPEIFEADVYLSFYASTYLAKLIFKALGNIFNGASAIQQWLGECATQICQSLTPEQIRILEDLAEEGEGSKQAAKKKKSMTDALAEHSRFKSSVIWTTPLGMPVVQPYRAHETSSVSTNIQSFAILAPHSSDSVLKRRQLQGFPPNFIHSLDATHMLLSALKCDELGISFAAVHDSFWTHAADVDTMSTVLRDAFIRMHSDDIVGRLAAEFKVRYKENMCLIAVYEKSPLGRAITAWRAAKYKGSKSSGPAAREIGVSKRKKLTMEERRIAELLEERKRQQLLASDDPELRRQGEAMMTPTRMYAEMDKDARQLEDDAEGESHAWPELDSLRSQSLGDRDSDPQSHLGAELDSQEAEPSLRNAADVFAPGGEDGGEVESAEREGPPPELNGSGPSTTGEKVIRQYKERFQKQSLKGSSGARRTTWVWLPMSLPPVPQKGDWDVSRLKQSKYFFS